MNVCMNYISERYNINKMNASKENDICDYCYFLNKGFKYELNICNDCHDLTQKAMSFNDVAYFC